MSCSTTTRSFPVSGITHTVAWLPAIQTQLLELVVVGDLTYFHIPLLGCRLSVHSFVTRRCGRFEVFGIDPPTKRIAALFYW